VRTSIGRKALLADSCADPRRISPQQAERLVVNLASCPDLDGFVGALEDENGKAIRFNEAERVLCPVLIVLPERDRFTCMRRRPDVSFCTSGRPAASPRSARTVDSSQSLVEVPR
jgi:hypothetical protein